MVLAERNSDNLRNGRRSRGPSPNGHASDSTSEEEGGKKFKMFETFLLILKFITFLFDIENFRPTTWQSIVVQIYVFFLFHLSFSVTV